MRERDLQAAILELARLLGWRVAHFRPARTARGWRTPVEGDGAGFPDLVLAKAPRLLVRELKSEMGTLSAEQELWLASFRLAGIDVGIWRPADWTAGVVEAELRGLVMGEQAVLREVADLVAKGVLVPIREPSDQQPRRRRRR